MGLEVLWTAPEACFMADFGMVLAVLGVGYIEHDPVTMFSNVSVSSRVLTCVTDGMRSKPIAIHGRGEKTDGSCTVAHP